MIRVAIAHADFRPERKAAFDRLLAQLKTNSPEGLEIKVITGKCEMWERGEAAYRFLAEGPGHGIYLTDDAVLCEDFWTLALAAIQERPNEVISFFCSHRNALSAYEAGARHVTTCDGLIAIAFAAPPAFFKEWADTLAISTWRLLKRQAMAEDTIINHWVATNRKFIHHPLPPLSDHDLSLESTWNNPHQSDPNQVHLLKSSVPIDSPRTPATREPAHLGRLIGKLHWYAINGHMRPTAEQIEGAYFCERHGQPVDEDTHVMVCTPSYTPPLLQFLRSRDAVCQDLVSNGIKVSTFLTPGDSYVQRGRQRITHAFLKSTANWLLWWDNDIEAVDPSVVRSMLLTGKDIIGGAIPFKNNTGTTVGNLWDEDIQSGRIVSHRGAVRARDVGCGFMLVSRKAIVRLMEAHPELGYMSQHTDDSTEPLYAIWDSGVEHGVYLTEDYYFCNLWQELGEEVYLYVPGRFKHWGMYGYEGTLEKKYGMVEGSTTEAAE